MVKKTTSLKVEEELWKKVKINCILNDVDISGYIENLIKEDLKKNERKSNSKWKAFFRTEHKQKRGILK